MISVANNSCLRMCLKKVCYVKRKWKISDPEVCAL